VDHCTSCKIVSRKNSSLKAFYLIDTHDLRLIHSTEPLGSLPYVALSYVWVKPQFLNLTEMSLPMFCQADRFSKFYSSIPQTIRDAISVCKVLGERYVSVDSLCIVQDSPNKTQVIAQMDLIYGYATFTIVAACGNSANPGLVGISSERITQQYRFSRAMNSPTSCPHSQRSSIGRIGTAEVGHIKRDCCRQDAITSHPRRHIFVAGGTHTARTQF